jgi:glycosyltransferase involved in cell wall biosynthesis
MHQNLGRAKCSVLLPVRNGEKFVRESLQNLIQMTTPDDEILIINDGSTDSTSAILAEFQELHERVKVIDTPPLGLVSALNIGLESAKNDFIARADIDDLYLAERIDLQLNYLESHPAVGAVFSDYVFFSEKEGSLGYMPTGFNSSATKLSIIDAFRTPHPSVAFRRGAILEVGGYLEEEFPAEDLGLWIRLSSKYELGSIPQPLLSYRINPFGISGSRQIAMRRKKNELLRGLNYTQLLMDNLNSYKEIQNAYRRLSHRNDRLALHNLDLFLCIHRADIAPFLKIKAYLIVAVRFLDPRISYALIRLLVDRRTRHKNA